MILITMIMIFIIKKNYYKFKKKFKKIKNINIIICKVFSAFII